MHTTKRSDTGPSMEGGIITEAPALKEHKDMKKYIAQGSDGKDLQVIIRFNGEFIGSRENAIGEFMEMVKRETTIPFAEEASEIPTREHQWMPMKDARYVWRGDIVAKLARKSEVLHLYRSLEGKAITVADGGRIVLEIMPRISLLAEARAHAVFTAAATSAAVT